MESIDLAWVQTALIFVLPIIIGFLKKYIVSLDGAGAYWWSLGLQFAIGLLAALQGNNPMLALQGIGYGFATVGYFEGGKRLGLAGRNRVK